MYFIRFTALQSYNSRHLLLRYIEGPIILQIKTKDKCFIVNNRLY